MLEEISTTSYLVQFDDGLHEIFCCFDDASRSIICYDMGNHEKLVKGPLALLNVNTMAVNAELAKISKPVLADLSAKKLLKMGKTAFASADAFDFK